VSSSITFLLQIPSPTVRASQTKEEKSVDVGKALSHDIVEPGRSEKAASDEIDRFISKRSKLLKPENREYREEQAWRESTRRHNAAREAELREEWSSWHLAQAERHKAVLASLVARHEEKAQQLMNGGPDAA
jgi:hypothetical protein